MKGRILATLRAAETVVSGETLSQTLGVSRVTVWKHIRKLQEAGYPISAGPTGYRLEGDPDALYPWEFPGREKTLHYHPRVDSTMTVARTLARASCPHMTVVVAGCQQRGRGRLQRVWRSAEGGLYFTLVLRLDLPPVLAQRANFAASLVLARTLQELYGVPAQVKWPNDILVAERKLCGMLSEMEVEGDLAAFINIGIGVNVNHDPSGEEPMATSLAALLGRPVSRRELLACFLDRLEQRLQQPELADVIAEWKTQSATLGRRVRIVTTRETAEGLARDVDENGALILEDSAGVLRKIIYGDCFHHRSRGTA
ncbi:MAG TPA: biotin--[acetyl-CoA-carboxylase] ligase [Desulfobacterales bacterium]|nr:biotin--[acetyl-CoA-carboxylase] ligase [Desulfobacterales bacterium]